MEETIVALATPAGRGGVAVIRISGLEARSIGGGLCGELPESWSLKPCVISDSEGEIIDSGLVVFFACPKSYTGEDVVEVHCHGNPLIVDSVVSAAVKLGARMAAPGEFTKRAFLNDKIDLAQAESVSDLISARTKSAVKGAGSSLSGAFSKTIHDCVDRLTKIRVVVEGGMDFPEEGEIQAASGDAGFVCGNLREELSFLESLLTESRAGLRLREGAKIVIVGPPNCGKSTLLNLFAGGEMAIVSGSPGTTRDTVRAAIDLGGVPVEVVDTAGIRDDGAGPIEVEGMHRAMREARGADLVLAMSEVGGRLGFSFDEVPVLRVFNKVDLCSGGGFDKIKGAVFISALKGDGFEELVEKMCFMIGAGLTIEVPVLARRRHLSFLISCKSNLVRALEIAGSLGSQELVAEELKEAQFALNEITNPVSSDDLLGEIFSSFCVGK